MNANTLERTLLCISVAISLGIALGPAAALAANHTWDVSEVFSNADGTIQFVELKETNGGNSEGGVGNGQIMSNLKTFAGTNGVVAGTANKFYLVATQAFADLPGAPVPDAIITSGLLPFFFDPAGDSVDFRVYDTCTFGAIPTDGIDSYNCLGASTGPNTPTNFAGASGSVDASASITLGQVDDFQDGTLQNWCGGSNPVVQANGGPLGTGDQYLEISSTSFNLGTFNLDQWSGDYDSEGVGAVELDANNFGPDALSLRVLLMTPGCDGGGAACTAWASTDATLVASGSGWVAAGFSLDEADMTQVLGSDSHTATLQNVERLLIRHDDGTPDPPGSSSLATATLGIDNVTATMPEPTGLASLVAGVAALGLLNRRRRTASSS
jgi:hypothetical protein